MGIKVPCLVPLCYSNKWEHATALTSKGTSMRPVSLAVWHWGLPIGDFTPRWFSPVVALQHIDCFPVGSIISYSSLRGVTAEIRRDITEYSEREKWETRSLAEVPAAWGKIGPRGAGAQRRLPWARCACPHPRPARTLRKSEGMWYKARSGYFAITHPAFQVTRKLSL